MNPMLKKYLEKASMTAGKVGEGIKAHPYATIGAGAAGAAAHHAMSDDDDGLEGALHSAKDKLGGLVDEGGDAIHHLLRKMGLK